MEKCGICLNLVQNTIQIKELDRSHNESWLKKLETIVPEIEWLGHYPICNNCAGQLTEVTKFRNKCIELDELRRNMFSTPNLTDNEKFEELYIKSTIETTNSNCDNTFNSPLQLNQHESADKNELELEENQSQSSLNNKNKPYKCSKCGKVYKQEKVMQKHNLNCNGIKWNQKISINNELKPKGRRSKKIFSCELCDETRNFVKQLIEHCINDHSMERKTIKPYSCTQCDSRFSSSANLVQHEKYHEGNRTHICSICGKSYITKSDLTVHEYTHYNRRNYKCEVCDKAFNTNKNLRSHKLVVHTDSNLWKYVCLKCNKRFPLKSGYEQHLRRHNGDKRFLCHICTKPFISRSELQKHLLFHSNIRAFKCEHCQKEYKERKIYEIHLAKVHGLGDAKIPVRVRKFACHLCPKMYFDRQKLSRHLLLHSGLKPFGCNVCDKKFIDKYYLKQHLKSIHNVCENNSNIILKDLLIKSDEQI